MSWKEITERSYTGKRAAVFSFVMRLRKALGMPAKSRASQDGNVVPPNEQPLTPHTEFWHVIQQLDNELRQPCSA